MSDELEAVAWLCICGDFTESCHCPSCYREAPWGCDCGAQDEHAADDDEPTY